jgi:hypothetical protein
MLSQSDKFATIIQSKLRRAVVHRPFCTLAAAARRIQTNFRVTRIVHVSSLCVLRTYKVLHLTFQSLQNKNLAQLPKLLATLHENRSEIEELKALNCLLIEQLDNESAKVRYTEHYNSYHALAKPYSNLIVPDLQSVTAWRNWRPFKFNPTWLAGIP